MYVWYERCSKMVYENKEELMIEVGVRKEGNILMEIFMCYI